MEIEDTAKQVLKLARKEGLDHVDVLVERGEEMEVQILDGKVVGALNPREGGSVRISHAQSGQLPSGAPQSDIGGDHELFTDDKAPPRYQYDGPAALGGLLQSRLDCPSVVPIIVSIGSEVCRVYQDFVRFLPF